MNEKYDIVIVGGGPGGYPAAIRASQLGASVALVEMDKLGGECTNYGCVPTKALVKLSTVLNLFRKVNSASDFERFFSAAFDEARRTADEVSNGVSTLLRGYNVEVYRGEASFTKDGNVILNNGSRLSAKNYIIATGTDPQPLSNIKFDGEKIHNNRTILQLKKKPSSLIIVGGGYVGVEMAYVFSSLGVEVTLIEALDRLLFYLDKDLSRYALRVLRRQGVKVRLKSPVKEVKVKNREVIVGIGNESLSADMALIAVGRRPKVPVGLEYLNVKKNEKGYIIVDGTLRSSNPKVYATGDISGPPLLAHKAMLQAEIAAENIMGIKSEFKDIPIPQVTFTEPEIASVGMTLEEALAKGIEASESKFPTGGLAKSRIEGVIDGFVKIVYESNSKRILGIHMAGPMSSELIAEATAMVKLGIKLNDLIDIVHPHPTASEALREAALFALKRPTHYILKLRR